MVECFRRVALTGLAVFVYPDSSAQIAIVLFLATVFMVVSEVLSPLSCPIEMWLYRTGHYVVFASMFLALLLRVDISNERERSQVVFSGVIVVAHAAMILVVVGQGLLIFVEWECPDEPREVAKVLDDCPVVNSNNDGGGNEDAWADHNLNPLYGGKETPPTTTTTTLRGHGAPVSTASPPSRQLQNRCNRLELEQLTPAANSFLVSDLSRPRPSSSALTLSAFKTAPPLQMHSARQSQDEDRSRRGQSLTRPQLNAAANTAPLAVALEKPAGLRESPLTPTSVVSKSVRDGGAHAHGTLFAAGLEAEHAKALSPQSWLSSAAPGERPRSSPVFSGRELFGGRSARWGWPASLLSAEEKSEISELSKCSEDLAVGGRSWSPRGRLFHPTTTAATAAADGAETSASVVVKRSCISPPDPGPPGGIDAAPTTDVKVGEGSTAGKRSLVSGHARERISASAHPTPSLRTFLSNPEPVTKTTHTVTSYELACGAIILSPAETPRTDVGQETPRSLSRSVSLTGDSSLPHEARTPRMTGRARQSFFRSPDTRGRSPLRHRKTWLPGSLPVDEHSSAAVSVGHKSHAERSGNSSRLPAARAVAPRAGQEGQQEGRSRKGLLSGSSHARLVVGGAEPQRTFAPSGRIHGSAHGISTTEDVSPKSRSGGGVYTGRGNAPSAGYQPAQGVPIEPQGGRRGVKSERKVKVVVAEATGVHEERKVHEEQAGWHPILRSPTY